jgi:hypothetical protein
MQRVALVFLFSWLTWLAILAVPMAEVHGYFDCQILRNRFVGSLVVAFFPFITSVFEESTQILLTILHWALTCIAFCFVARRLSSGLAFIAALFAVPMFGGLVYAVLHVAGVTT